METSFDVKIWKTEVYEGRRGTSYYVRWAVAGRRQRKPFKQAALADSFRSNLVSAARKGEAFDIATGLPISMRRTTQDMPWYRFACAFVDMKWPHVAATTRRTHAEAMMTVTTAMFTNIGSKPDDKLIRSALCRWGFNTNRRDDPNMPAEVAAALRWLEKHTRPVSDLRRPDALRAVLNSLAVKLDGTPAAPSVVGRKRRIFNTSVEHAVERELLTANPIPALKWKPPRPLIAVDRRSVANPLQVRSLLNAVREQQRSGPRLVAFFGCLYFAALRPEEAVALKKHNLSLPERGWGELHLETAEPHAGKEWTDSGENRDRRQLKQRERGETRTVPCPPELTALLHAHIAEFEPTPDGRIFTGERNDSELPKLTITRAWKRARADTFVDRVAASPLARTPYDLRHAAVSTWLNGGIPSADVAKWAGHSVEILHKIYAKCLDGSGETLRQRIDRALGH